MFTLARIAVEVVGLVIVMAVARSHFGWSQSDVNWFLFAYWAWDASKSISRILREESDKVSRARTPCTHSA